MTHRHNPGFDDWASYSCEDGPGTSPTSVSGWPEREYRESEPEQEARGGADPSAVLDEESEEEEEPES